MWYTGSCACACLHGITVLMNACRFRLHDMIWVVCIYYMYMHIYIYIDVKRERDITHTDRHADMQTCRRTDARRRTRSAGTWGGGEGGTCTRRAPRTSNCLNVICYRLRSCKIFWASLVSSHPSKFLI